MEQTFEYSVDNSRVEEFLHEMKNPNIEEPRMTKNFSDGKVEINFWFFDVKVFIFPEQQHSMTRKVQIVKGSKTKFDNLAFAKIFVDYFENK